jgi:hypothetical protein
MTIGIVIALLALALIIFALIFAVSTRSRPDAHRKQSTNAAGVATGAWFADGGGSDCGSSSGGCDSGGGGG